jgi:hypothetical protein
MMIECQNEIEIAPRRIEIRSCRGAEDVEFADAELAAEFSYRNFVLFENCIHRRLPGAKSMPPSEPY